MGWTRFFRRARWDRERLAEIESYVQIETDENLARGLSHADALAAARKKFGNATSIREDIYAINTLAFVDQISRDVRYGVRMLRQSPLFSAVALLTLAIGIGANTAVFAVLNSILLRPLPYPNPDRLVALRQTAPGAAGLATLSDGLLLSPSMYFTYAEHNRTFQSLGVWSTGTANVTGIAEPEQVRVAEVTSGVLETLAVSPVLGRWLDASDQLPNGPKSVMLSYGYWQRRFSGDPGAIGRTLRVDLNARQIVGVMPRGFRMVNADFDLIVAAAFDRRTLTHAGFGYNGVARLKPGITPAQADADLKRLVPVWIYSWSNGPGSDPSGYEKWRITPAIRSLKRDVIGNIGDVLWVVMGTIALVMLIACANVTNLLLVRTEARQQELALRAALGAGRGRIVQGLLIESAIIGSAGCALAFALAHEALRLLAAIGPANLPRLNEVSLDLRAVGFGVGLCVLASILVGLIPALKYAGPRISIGLRSVERTASASRERYRSRNLLVIGQVALSLVLLVSAGLMIRTFQALRDVAPGFTDAKHLETMRTSIPASLIAEPERVTRMQEQIAQRLAAIPGVAFVAFTNQMPMEGYDSEWDEISAEGMPSKGIAPLRLYKYVSPAFFHTAGTRIIAGRELTWQDIYGLRPVVLISENLAREFWGGASNALGKRLREFEGMPWREVVGVVQDTAENGVDKAAPATVYWPSLMRYLYGRKEPDAVRAVTFIMRTPRAGTNAFLREMQRVVWSVEAQAPVASARTMQDIYDASLSRTSFTLTMLAIAAGMALVLGVIGIYGVISYTVSRRTREIGIRLALGARNGEVQRMFVRDGITLASIGLGIGLVAALCVTRLMKSLLFGTSPVDPLTYAAVPVVLGVAAVLASYLPARRAAGVNPIEALRAE